MTRRKNQNKPKPQGETTVTEQTKETNVQDDASLVVAPDGVQGNVEDGTAVVVEGNGDVDKDVEVNEGETTSTTDVPQATVDGIESSTGPKEVKTNVKLEKTETPEEDKQEQQRNNLFSRNRTESDLFKLKSSELEQLAERLDTLALPDFSTTKGCQGYVSLFERIVSCLKVEKVTDMTALVNFTLDLMDKYDRTFSDNRLFAPLQNAALSVRDQKLYSTLYGTLNGLRSKSKIDKDVLTKSLDGSMDSELSERFVRLVMELSRK